MALVPGGLSNEPLKTCGVFERFERQESRDRLGIAGMQGRYDYENARL